MAEQSQDTSIDNLLTDLQNSKDAYVRKVAAEQLGERMTNNEQVIDALKFSTASDENKYVRDAAYYSLIKLGAEKATPEGNHLPLVEEKPLTNRQAIGIGASAGLILVFVISLFLLVKDIQNRISIHFQDISVLFLLSFIIGLPGILFGMLGALVVNQGKNSKLTIWISAFVGAILGLACLFAVLSNMGFFMW